MCWRDLWWGLGQQGALWGQAGAAGETWYGQGLTPRPRSSSAWYHPPSSRLTFCTSGPSVLEDDGGSWGSGLAALGGLGGGLGLPRASEAGHWALADSSGGSGEAVVGELLGEAGELDVPSGGACSRNVTVVTSRLVTSGVGVGSGTSVCCSCLSGSSTCGVLRIWPRLPRLAGAQGRACKAESLGMASRGHTCTSMGTGVP